MGQHLNLRDIPPVDESVAWMPAVAECVACGIYTAFRTARVANGWCWIHHATWDHQTMWIVGT